MKANKEDKFRSLLKQAGGDQPVGDFTDAVMNMIGADAMQEAALKSLLKKHPAEGPAFHFTAGVMAQINAKPKAMVFQPIITKKAWFGIACAFCAAFLLLIGLSNSQTSNIHRADNVGTVITRYVATIPAAYPTAAAIIATLFLADYLFTRRIQKSIAG